MRRKPMGRRESRRDFRRKAGVHRKNSFASSTLVMRGGIRL